MRFCLLVLFALLMAGPAYAAPSVTSGTACTGSPGADPDVCSYAIGAGSNVVLHVGVTCRKSGGSTLNSATYAGNAMNIRKVGNLGGEVTTYLLDQVAPTSGTNNISIDWAAACTQVLIVPMTIIDASQSADPTSNTATTNGTGNSSVTCTSATGELVLDTTGYYDGGHTMSVGAGQTQLNNTTVGGGNILGASSWEAGAASVAMTWTLSAGSDSYSAVCASYMPFVASSRRRQAPMVMQ